MAARGRSSSGTARLLVLVGILTVLGATFGVGVYTGRIWSARAAVVAAHAPETEPARRGPGRGGRLPEAPAPQLTFYRELTAPLTAPPPPPRPAKTAPPPLVTVPPRPGEQADTLGAATRAPTSGARDSATTRFTVQIARDYAGETPVLVGVLQGAFLFMADLVRAIPGDITTDFIGLASYAGGNRSSGQVRIVSDLAMPVENRHVVVVEDIVDTGLTISYLRRNLEARHPRTLRVCALVDKIERRQVDVRIDYVGFTIPNVFVVGYGFDFGGLYRNLPYVAALDETPP